MPSPTYQLTASLIPAGNRIRNFHGDQPGSPRHQLEHPPRLRDNGFDTATYATAKPIEPDGYEVSNQGDRKVLQLFQDGTALFRVAADPRFLAWSVTPDDFARVPRLNPVPVVEMHVSFVLFYASLIPRFAKPPDSVRFTLHLRAAHADGKRLALTRYVPNFQTAFNLTLHYAHATEIEESLTVATKAVLETPEHVAYQLVERFYSEFFDVTDPSLIPFVTEKNGVAAIDSAQLQEL
jgi:hypothetical protein